MPIYIIRPTEGPDLAVEGADLSLHFKEGCDVVLIAVLDSNQRRVAVMASDAVTVVYQKNAEKDTSGVEQAG